MARSTKPSTVGHVFCSHNGCKQSYMPHRWAPETNKGSKWFHQKTGESWCPKHRPEWYEAWRAKQKEKEDGGA